MRTYPLPRAAVDTALASQDPHPLVADGNVTEDQILMLADEIAADGPSERTGGLTAAKWVRRMSDKFRAEHSPACPDGECDDVGFYAVVDPDDHNVAYSVLRSDDFVGFDQWAEGEWKAHDLPDEIDLRILTEDDAKFIMDALDEGCDGAYLHPGDPIGFLPRDTEVVLAASYPWDESKHKRDETGRFTFKDSSGSSSPSRGSKMGADLAKYVRSGGPRPSGVKATTSKSKGSSGGSGGSSSSSSKSSAAAAKKKAEAARKKAKAEAAKKARAKWQRAYDKYTNKENRTRTRKAEADIQAEVAKQEREARNAQAQKEIGDRFAEMMAQGMSVAEAESAVRQMAAEQSARFTAEKESAEQAEKIRKLEYARRMAALREAKARWRNKRPTLSSGVVAAADEDGWVMYAVVDELDPNAVMAVIRMRRGDSGLELQVWADGDWQEDTEMMARLQGVAPPPLVELTEDQIESLLQQMEADAGVTAAISPDPRAARLRAYWVTGKGRLKIRWGTPGDFTRCVRQLRKYLGPRTKGYCANLHKLATGMWPGDRRNRGVRGSGPSEDVLCDAVLSGGWRRELAEVDMLRDGIYSEAIEDDVIGALIAGASFPVEPPDDWFQDPGLKGPTPLTVDDDGHIYGHIATFDVPHIGMPGRVHAPRSRSGYAFFKTGQLVTASGQKINVGQLTLAGGHAPLSADARAAVEHYDNTNSAVADLNAGEDRFGIWVAGAVRPEISPEQMRALRAAAPSGDWRPINGSLELVAVTQVNVPGFPVARARVASGAVVALVAAGARPLAVQKASLLADAAVLERIDGLERLVMGEQQDEQGDLIVEEVPETDTEAETTETEVEATEEAAPVSEAIERARAYIRDQRMERLRNRVYHREPEAQVAAFKGEWSGKAER